MAKTPDWKSDNLPGIDFCSSDVIHDGKGGSPNGFLSPIHSSLKGAKKMMDMSIPVVLGTIVAEIVVVVSSFVFSDYLNRSGQVKLDLNSRARMDVDGREDASNSKRPPKTMSYKDEKETYFDHAATATQMKFERDMNDPGIVTPPPMVKAHSNSH
jgi:hypothetical protein